MAFDTMTLQCFLAVAEAESFTRAAARIGRTQSAVSQQIGKLEAQLGKPLFHRDKALMLTEDGAMFLHYARQIFALHREALDRFREPELAGQVHFGLPEDFATVYLSEVLADFAQQHPRILLNVECDLTLNLFERFKQGAFDLVLVKMSQPEDFPNGQEIWSERLEWVGERSLLANAGKAGQPLPLVLSPQPCVYRARAIQALEKSGQPWRLVYSSPSYAGTVAAVKAGLGITVLPRTMIPEPLTPIKSKLLPALSDTHISLLKHDDGNPALQSFEEFVLSKLR